MMTELDILNWESEGGPVFYPRLRDTVQEENGLTEAGDDEAPEIDVEYDCD